MTLPSESPPAAPPLVPAARRTARTLWSTVGGLVLLGTTCRPAPVDAHRFTDTSLGLVACTAGALLTWRASRPLIQSDRRLSARFSHLGRRHRPSPA
ncbi:hypothetical protein [Oerskovia enterophila]